MLTNIQLVEVFPCECLAGFYLGKKNMFLSELAKTNQDLNSLSAVWQDGG